MNDAEIRQIEDLVNGFIMANEDVVTRQMNVSEAIEAGATALFDEKYGDTVRVVRVGEVSMELCGGTHVRAAGDIGLFKIVSEAGIAAGVRRIEALTGTGALDFVHQIEDEHDNIAVMLKSEGGSILDRLEKMLLRQRDMQREIEALQGKLNAAASGDLLSQVVEVIGIRLLAVKVSVQDSKDLRELSDTLRDRLGSGVIVLGAEVDGKANLLVSVTPDLCEKYRAGDIIKRLAPLIGGSGGGRPEMAQAGGTMPGRLEEALEEASKTLLSMQ
jgi:alanyl-tRNA synthetase